MSTRNSRASKSVRRVQRIITAFNNAPRVIGINGVCHGCSRRRDLEPVRFCRRCLRPVIQRILDVACPPYPVDEETVEPVAA